MGLPYHPSHEIDANESQRSRRRRWLLPTALAAALLLALAAAAAARPGGFWHHGQHAGHGDPELMRDHAAFMVERMLARVDATPEQVAEVQALVDGTIRELAALHGSAGDVHAEVTAALTADTIDRDAIEAVRREKLAAVDRASQRIVATLADVSEVLTPAQRVALAEQLAEWHGRFRH